MQPETGDPNDGTSPAGFLRLNANANAPSNNHLYLQLALTAGGQVLGLIICLLAWQAWKVLADYQGALVWSLLCSIALRDLRDYLVDSATARLSQGKSLPAVLLLLLRSMFSTLTDTVQDIRFLYSRWRQNMLNYVKVYRKQARKQMQVHFTPPAAAAPEQPALQGEATGGPPGGRTAPSGAIASDAPRAAPARARHEQVPAPSSAPGLAGTVGISLKNMAQLPRWWATCMQLGVETLRSSSFRKQRTRRRRPAAGQAVPSNVLFQWLLRACIVYQAYLWLRASFAFAVQALLLTLTLLATLGVPLLLAVSAHWFASSSADTAASAGDDSVNATPKKPFPQQRQPRSSRRSFEGARAAVQWPVGRLAAADRWLSDQLRAHIRPIVSAGLICSTITGTVLLSAFFTVQIAQESRVAVTVIREALPQNWSLPAQEWPLPQSAAPPPVLRRLLSDYQPQVVQAMGHAVPWVEAKVATLLQQYNLTQLADELKSLQRSLQPPRRCTPEELQAALIALAKARRALQRQIGQHRTQQLQVDKLDAQLAATLRAWQQNLGLLPSHTAANAQEANKPGGSATSAAAGSHIGSTDSSDRTASSSEEAIVHLDNQLRTTQEALQAADAALQTAQRDAQLAERRYKQCSSPPQRQRAASDSVLGRQLQAASQSFGSSKCGRGWRSCRRRRGTCCLQPAAACLAASRRSCSSWRRLLLNRC